MNSRVPASAVHVRLLGTPSIERDGMLLSGRVAQRHRVALLALLALAPDGRLSRDKLLALLWPEHDAERARNVLSVSVYAVRSALGDDALVSMGDDLRLNPHVIRTDVAELEAALARGDHAAAVALYAGPFLDGFFLTESPDFQEWVERERKRLADLHARALEALADGSEKAGDFAAATERWKARAVQDPYDSRIALRLMEAMARAGNRAGALQHASVHERLLRQEFGIALPGSITALAERLRQAPIDATPPRPVEPWPSAATDLAAMHPAAPPGESTIAAPEVRDTRTRRRRIAAGAVVVAAAAAVFAIWMVRSRAPGGGDRSVAVLPFANLSAEADNEFFSDGLTEEIITRLAAIPELKVISRTSVMRYKGTGKNAREIADELAVAHILEGSVRRRGNRARITAKLVNARTDEQLWAHNYDYAVEDVFRVQEDIARQVVAALELRLGERQQATIARRGTRNAEAYELYRRGRHLWNTRTRQAHERALEYFRRALERDSMYADAYAGMADVYLTAYQLGMPLVSEDETYSRIKWGAERALALDGNSADARTSFAVALWWQRNWPGAERELRRAVELNPGHAMARSWLGLLLTGQGRLDEALREGRRAYEVDPFAPIVSGNYAVFCYLTRDYDCALEQLRRTLDLGALVPRFEARLAFSYAHKGNLDTALTIARGAAEAAPDRPDVLADLAYVQALAGHHAAARATLGRSKLPSVEPFNVARAYAALGEADSAFAWLERSAWQWPHRAVRADPALDPLRRDPRFARLSLRIDREMGLR